MQSAETYTVYLRTHLNGPARPTYIPHTALFRFSYVNSICAAVVNRFAIRFLHAKAVYDTALLHLQPIRAMAHAAFAHTVRRVPLPAHCTSGQRVVQRTLYRYDTIDICRLRTVVTVVSGESFRLKPLIHVRTSQVQRMPPSIPHPAPGFHVCRLSFARFRSLTSLHCLSKRRCSHSVDVHGCM